MVKAAEAIQARTGKVSHRRGEASRKDRADN